MTMRYTRLALEAEASNGHSAAQLAIGQRKAIAELKHKLALAEAATEIAEKQVRELALLNSRLQARIAELETRGAP